MSESKRFAGLTAIITGASRGIGKEIALKLAKDGANIVVAAKTVESHPKLPGTIYTAAEEIIKAGGKALACVVDVRDEASVDKAVEATVRQFGGIDILINNASAISLTPTLDTPMKRYDLMHQINTRGTFLMSQKCIPYLKQAKNPHILNISPPLLMDPKWFANHVAYTMAKYGMSMCVLGMSEEFRGDGIAVNALWPRTAIWTSAMELLGGSGAASGCRKPSIMADAAYALLSRNSRNYTGNFVIDDDLLREEGVTEFDHYAIDPSAPLMPDFFVPGVEYQGPEGHFDGSKKRSKSREAIRKSSSSGGDVATTLESIKQMLTPEMVKKVNAIYQFNLKTDSGERILFVNLKTGSGTIGEGMAPEPATVTFTLRDGDFAPMFSGQLSPTKAFMSGQLKIHGDMGKAMALETLIKQINKSKL